MDARQRLARPLVEVLHAWLLAERARMSKHNLVAKAINHMLSECIAVMRHRDGARWSARCANGGKSGGLRV